MKGTAPARRQKEEERPHLLRKRPAPSPVRMKDRCGPRSPGRCPTFLAERKRKEPSVRKEKVSNRSCPRSKPKGRVGLVRGELRLAWRTRKKKMEKPCTKRAGLLLPRKGNATRTWMGRQRQPGERKKGRAGLRHVKGRRPPSQGWGKKLPQNEKKIAAAKEELHGKTRRSRI